MFWWRLLLGLFVFVLMAMLMPSQNRSVPPCTAYSSALERAEDRNDPDNLDALRALYVTSGTDGPISGPSAVPCSGVVLGDYGVADEDNSEGASDAKTFKHRAELVAGLKPRTDAKGYRGAPNAFSMDYYQFDAESLALARDKRLHPYKWFAVKAAYYGVPILLALALIASFFFVHGSGRKRQVKIIGAFSDAVRNGYSELSAGGVRWQRIGDEFFPAHSLTTSDHATRLEREAWVQFALPVLAIVFSSFIPIRILPLQPIYPGSSLDSLVANVTRYQDQLIAVFAFSLLVIAYEWVFRQGYQGIWGAMVLDPAPELLQRFSFRDQKAHGTARESLESEALGAAAGDARRSSVHDQKF